MSLVGKTLEPLNISTVLDRLYLPAAHLLILRKLTNPFSAS